MTPLLQRLQVCITGPAPRACTVETVAGVAVGVDDDGELRCVTAVGSLSVHERRAIAQRLRALADEIDHPPEPRLLH